MKTRAHRQQNRGRHLPAYCVCALCGAAMRHVPGVPCNARNCPQCGHATYKSYEEVAADKILKIQEEQEEDFEVQETSRSTKYPVVQPELCTACGACIEVCPADCIEYLNGKAFVQENNCRNCKICVTACPENAFKIK